MALYIPESNDAAVAAAEAMSQASQVPDLGASFVRMFLSLIVLIGLMFLTYWFLRRIIQQKLQRGNQDAAIQILEKRMLSPKTVLYLLEIEGKKVLIAESHLEVKRLEGLDKRDDER